MHLYLDDNNDESSQSVLTELENIDDECDTIGVTFVKIDNADEAKEYGIDTVPKLLYFEKGIPTVYEGNLLNEQELLRWLEMQTTSDEIEDITDEMLDLIIEKMPYVAVLFCKILTHLHCLCLCSMCFVAICFQCFALLEKCFSIFFKCGYVYTF